MGGLKLAAFEPARNLPATSISPMPNRFSSSIVRPPISKAIRSAPSYPTESAACCPKMLAQRGYLDSTGIIGPSRMASTGFVM